MTNAATEQISSESTLGGYDRVLYRVTIEGGVPRGVDGRSSESVEGEAFLGA
ncbi:hypothetical protein [Nocardia sp. NPDC005366]|uniref:hypothetical protein n=1 Tax=Nocardia sp. NPDC005366 TaxID=3156878 RepID=UPI0033B5D37C